MRSFMGARVSGGRGKARTNPKRATPRKNQATRRAAVTITKADGGS